VVFVDSNVVMYLVGAPHPARELAAAFLKEHAAEEFVTSVEVYQEIIHRYVAIDHRQAITDAFALLDQITARSVPIHREQVDRAHEVAMAQRRLSGRDCLHVAVMEYHGIDVIFTFDKDFDYWPGFKRVP
jgi:uncharacterized protein